MLKKLFLVLCFLFISIFSFINVNASDNNFNIENLYINAKITEKGDINISEEITYNFQGNYNGIYRNLIKKEANGYTINNVSIRDKNNNLINLSQNNNSQDNSYQIIDSNENTQIKIFNKSDSEIKTFIFNYTIHDAAEKYSNYGVLIWNFYSVQNNNNIKNVNLTLSLDSKKFDINKLKYWCDVNGGEFSTSNNDTTINVKGSNLSSTLGIKVIFQPEYLVNPIKNYGNSSYTDINNSNSQPESLNEVKQDSLLKKELNIILIAGFLITSIVSIFIMKKRTKIKSAINNYRKDFLFFNEEILSFAPSDLPPTLVALLCNELKISFSTIPATLFYLTKKGLYSFEKATDSKEEDIIFVRNIKANYPDSNHLSYFMKWFKAYEKNGKISLKRLKDKLKKSEAVSSFKNQYNHWKTLSKLDADNLNFYINIEEKNILTNNALNEKLQWKSFKKFIINYIDGGTFPQTLENIDDILIYAFAFDLNIVKFEKFFNRIESSANKHDDFGFFDVTTFCFWDDIDNSINYHGNGNHNFSSTDSSNFGGFSDGGGFSGGGGGDSGAF